MFVNDQTKYKFNIHDKLDTSNSTISKIIGKVHKLKRWYNINTKEINPQRPTGL